MRGAEGRNRRQHGAQNGATSASAGFPLPHGKFFCQLKTNRENLFIIIPLPRPLRQALCGGLFPSFQRRKGMQPQGREGAAKRKGRRAAAMRGGERRQRAHAPSATVEKNPRTDKERRQQPRARARGGNSSPAARAKTMSSGPAQRQGRRNFRRVSKNFSFLLHFFIKSLDYGGFLWYDEKKGAFLHIPVRKRLFEGETQCNMRS